MLPVDVLVVDHPLAASRLTAMRDEETDSGGFRAALHELTTMLVYEATRTAAVERYSVRTPVAETEGTRIANPPLLVPVLRAGLGMADAALALLPESSMGFVGLARDEETFAPRAYLESLPSDLTGLPVLVLDPMLATGGSSAATVDILKAWGAARIKQVSLIAAPEGIATLSDAHPDVDIHVAAVDRELNERGYIVPGLGDAGDRQFGTFAGPASEPGHAHDETAEVVRRLQRNLHTP